MSDQKYTDQTVMPYGEHKDKTLANIPSGYLIWLLENNRTTPPLKAYIEENMEVLRQEQKREAQARTRR